MKLLRPLLATLSILLLATTMFAQPICGFDAAHKERLAADPAYRSNVLKTESAIRTYLQQHPSIGERNANKMTESLPGQPSVLSGPPYTIPVVVHVIHTGGAVGSIYNPTDAQITGAIDYLNQVYNGTYSGLSGGVGDLQIQFALAKRDPNCNPTNGINRVDGSGVANYVSGGVKSSSSSSSGTNEINIKNLSRWDPTQYYNVWIVDKIDGNDGTSGQFIAGYAYFPGASSSLDGIVMLATQMVSGQKTLPHEIGHAFNLYHPFEGSSDVSTCPANANCNTDGDQVCDTDPISENISGGVVDFTCRTGTNTCTGTAYSVNTESNFMNYTSCYTLFTAGQKARMLAAAAGTYRASLTTSLGATAPNAGSTTCSPKIDFELTDDQETETTATTSGCRNYKDYSYNMVIGNSPTVAATATLSVTSGTAVQGVDYDVTTNGSFTSPSLALTFPAGSTASQAFTIRVYDNASVDGTRTFTLGFTVNNGGGNALAGDGRTAFKMTINDNDVAPTGPSTPTVTIGSDLGSIQSPLAAANAKFKSQFLYYASELTAAGVKAGSITALGLNIAKASGTSFVYSGMTIKVAQTTQAALYQASPTLYPLLDGSFTTVYSSAYTTTNGWNMFTFTTPFTWNGTSNLVFEICYDNGSTTGSSDNCEAYVDPNSSSNYIYATVNCGTAISSFGRYLSAKPEIQLTYVDAGTSVQTASQSRAEYLGPNADVYFYSQSDNKLLARIQNLSGWDYGCTTVQVDRTGTASTAFWNSNSANYLMSKTLKVTPTNNNTSGSYNITLYYTPTEVSGWQTATGQTVSNIQLVKVASQISDVTPSAPAGGGAVVIGTPTIGSLGTSTSLTYNFSTGFSGFGAGVPGSATLPLTLLDFTGHRQSNGIVLDWTTTYEAGTSRFGIEKSTDGANFTNIGYVAASGNSSSSKAYTFLDPASSQPLNYYRLQMIDLDGKYTYSKTVLVPGLSAGSIQVTPSPFVDGVDITFGQIPSGRVNLRLLDITGKQLLRKDDNAVSNGRIHLDVSALSLSPGIYLLEVNGQTIKLLKQ